MRCSADHATGGREHGVPATMSSEVVIWGTAMIVIVCILIGANGGDDE